MACQYRPRNENDELHTEARSAALQSRRARVNGNTSIEQENDKYTGPIGTEDGEEDLGDRRNGGKNDGSGEDEN